MSKLPPRSLNMNETKEWTPPKLQFKKDGTPSAACLKWFDDVQQHPEGYTGLKLDTWFPLPHQEPVLTEVPMELKHQGALKDWFISLGWKPTFWNIRKANSKVGMYGENGKPIRTSPKLHDKGVVCPNLEQLGSKSDIVKPITEWLSLRNRRSVLLNRSRSSGWLSNPRLAVDSRISAASSGLTNTKRQKHKVVANVPRVTSLLGREFRSLFVASEGKVFVGVDAAQLEARVKGHFTYKYDDGAYSKKLLDPKFDEHQENADLWGCERDQAKSPGYALQYNCGEAKFAETLNVPLGVGKRHFRAYWDKNWSLKKAVEEAQGEFERNNKEYITLIDGSKVLTRAKHSAFNAKCQGSGAKIMDMAGIIAQDYIETHGYVADRVIYYHDELQFETYEYMADDVGALLTTSLEEAGTYFNLNVPITGAYKIGKSWAETH